jgi:2'-hydroxyisoflavone reductase
LLEGIRDATGSKSELTWIDWKWLRKEQPDIGGYAPWYGQGPMAFMQVNNKRALATGLTFRPIEETAKDMIAQLDENSDPLFGQGGLDLETEAALLKRWHAEKG